MKKVKRQPRRHCFDIVHDLKLFFRVTSRILRANTNLMLSPSDMLCVTHNIHPTPDTPTVYLLLLFIHRNSMQKQHMEWEYWKKKTKKMVWASLDFIATHPIWIDCFKIEFISSKECLHTTHTQRAQVVFVCEYCFDGRCKAVHKSVSLLQKT